MKNKNKKEKWSFASVVALIVCSSFVILAITNSIDFRQCEADAEYEQVRLESEKQLQIADMEEENKQLAVTKEVLVESENKIKSLVKNYNARTILDSTRLKHPRYIIEAMFRLWERHGGKYDYVPYCIAAYESEFNTFTHATQGEDSRGLFQVNVANSWHRSRVVPERLFEPVYNMEYQFDELVRFEKAGIKRGLKGIELILYVARYGQRPNWSKCSAYITNRVKKAYSEFNNLKIN